MGIEVYIWLVWYWEDSEENGLHQLVQDAIIKWKAHSSFDTSIRMGKVGIG